MLLGTTIALKKENDLGYRGTVYVEFRQCDKCKMEFHVYLRALETVEKTFIALSELMKRNKSEDLCCVCQADKIASQVALAMPVGS